jgi:hypothetical protein
MALSDTMADFANGWLDRPSFHEELSNYLDDPFYKDWYTGDVRAMSLWMRSVALDESFAIDDLQNIAALQGCIIGASPTMIAKHGWMEVQRAKLDAAFIKFGGAMCN